MEEKKQEIAVISLVNEEARQFFVAVNYKEGYMEARRTAEPRSSRTGDKFTVGELVFTDCGELSGRKSV